jgi:FMN phosphatase YigB (HAD superfamily)
MIKAIVFDCYGVLVGQGFWDTYRAAGGDTEKDKQFIHDMLARANAALISSEDFAQTIADQIGISVDDWLATTARTQLPNEPLFEYITTTLKPKYKIGLLSNANVGSVERRIPPEKQAIFDAFVVSGEVGCMKPDREIFQIEADRLGVTFDEMVFVDDLSGFTAAATGYGIKSIQYKDFVSFKTQLEALLT